MKPVSGDDEEHAVDPVPDSAQTGRIAQVTGHGLVRAGPFRLDQFRRVVHERPYPHAPGGQGWHHEAGVLSGSADSQHAHTLTPS